MTVPSHVPGGDVGPGREQIPECGAAALHLRALKGRVGQAGALGRHTPCTLSQRALARAGAPPLVSVPWSGRERGGRGQEARASSCPPGMADPPLSQPSPRNWRDSLVHSRSVPPGTPNMAQKCFCDSALTCTYLCVLVSPAVTCTVPRASWPTSRRCWRTSFCHCSRPPSTLPATRSCISSWSM